MREGEVKPIDGPEAGEGPVTRKGKSSWNLSEGAEIVPGRQAMSLLGGGSRYEAYLAHDDELLTLVVAKLLRPDRVDDRDALAGLEDEYKVLRALDHPVIARGFDAVLDGDRPHITLEFLEGPRLSTLIRKYGGLPLEQLVPLAVQLCSALHYVHARGFVHLDVKPRNIIMGAPPRLIDLSIARSLGAARGLDVVIGTDAYMAPEQCLPEAGLVGPPADVWGLGVTLYQAITERLPYPRRSGDEPHPQIATDPEPLPDEVPRPIADLVESCLAKDPADRPAPRDLALGFEPMIAAIPRRPVLGRMRPRISRRQR